jgi:hypothetical protein
MYADILVFDRREKLTVLAQVRAYSKTSIEWATELLPDILMDEHRPPYLVLATRDQTYFWRNPVDHPVPVYALSTNELLKDHLQRLRTSAEEIDYGVLEMVLFDWLADATRDPLLIPQGLREVGFSNAIQDGRPSYQLAA